MIDRWLLIHSYRKGVEEGKAEPLLCPECKIEYISRIDENDDPMLWCYSCDGIIHLGVGFWDQLGAAVRDFEYFV